MQEKLDLKHVQANELRVKRQSMIPWMTLAIMVSTRLWLGGVVSESRNRRLADQVLGMVKACCLPRYSLLLVTDGWSAYPGSIQQAFRWTAVIIMFSGKAKQEASALISTQLIGELLLPEKQCIPTHR